GCRHRRRLRRGRRRPPRSRPVQGYRRQRRRTDGRHRQRQPPVGTHGAIPAGAHRPRLSRPRLRLRRAGDRRRRHARDRHAEPARRGPGAPASLRPKFRLPPQARDAMFLAMPALIAAWALAGFYASLGPSLVRRLGGTNSVTLGGLALTVLAVAGAATAFLTL